MKSTKAAPTFLPHPNVQEKTKEKKKHSWQNLFVFAPQVMYRAIWLNVEVLYEDSQAVHDMHGSNASQRDRFWCVHNPSDAHASSMALDHTAEGQ